MSDLYVSTHLESEGVWLHVVGIVELDAHLVDMHFV